MTVMIATGCPLATQAGAQVAGMGGNAVDCAVAAIATSLCVEPGIVGPGGGGFITVSPPGEPAVVIDAYMEMPGRGASADSLSGQTELVSLEYGGGVATYVGYGSVATPGAYAGLSAATERWGQLPWATLLGPSIEAAAGGFLLPSASAEYLTASRSLIFGWDPPSHAALHHADGRPKTAGDRLVLPSLAQSLRRLAQSGAEDFYSGAIASALLAAMEENRGIVTAADLMAYEPIERQPLEFDFAGWHVSTNPPPSVGGPVLAALLALAPTHHSPDTTAWFDEYVAAQEAVLSYRARAFSPEVDRVAAATSLHNAAAAGDLPYLRGSPSTTHTSAVDDSGLACSITMSAGYGSGAMPAGMWMNNSLGEIELLGSELYKLAPGTRLISNMAPTVARNRRGGVIAIGSPGADRITTSIASTLLYYLQQGRSLQAAVDAPRVHVELGLDGSRAAAEEGISDLTMPVRSLPPQSMFFGGVQVVSWDPNTGFDGAADGRRSGTVVLA